MSEDKLAKLETQIQNVNAAKIRAETQLEELRRQRDEILTQLQQMNIDPTTLATQIEQLKRELAEELSNIEAQIPEGF